MKHLGNHPQMYWFSQEIGKVENNLPVGKTVSLTSTDCVLGTCVLSEQKAYLI